MQHARWMWYARWIIIFAAFGLTALPVSAQPERTSDGVLVRTEGNLTLGPDATPDIVVVVDGDLTLAGASNVVVVVNGTAQLREAEVRTLVVVNGAAQLQQGTVVTGDVHLVEATVSQAEGAVVGGSIQRGNYGRFAWGVFVFGVLFAIGYALALLLGGLVMAAVAGRSARRAGTFISNEIGAVLLSALIIWIGLPLLAVLAFATIIGIPTSLGLLLIVLPAVGFLGYLTFGIWLGDILLERFRGRREPEHPYAASLVGIGLLVLVGALPVLGPIVTPISAIIGSGALGLLAWRATEWGPAHRAPDAALE